MSPAQIIESQVYPSIIAVFTSSHLALRHLLVTACHQQSCLGWREKLADCESKSRHPVNVPRNVEITQKVANLAIG